MSNVRFQSVPYRTKQLRKIYDLHRYEESMQNTKMHTILRTADKSFYGWPVIIARLKGAEFTNFVTNRRATSACVCGTVPRKMKLKLLVTSVYSRLLVAIREK